MTDWPKCSDNPTFGGLIHAREFCEIIQRLNIHPAGILDAGACDGRDSLVFKAAFPQARVVAVEGLRENYERWMLPLRPRVEPHYRVLASRTGEATFHVKNVNGIHGLYDRGTDYEGTARTVQVVSLDDFCREIGFWPDAVKIDCEGATYDILAGGEEAMKSVRVICFESESIEFFKGQKLHGHVSLLLRSLGFQRHLRRCGKSICSPNGKYGRQYESIWIRA